MPPLLPGWAASAVFPAVRGSSTSGQASGTGGTGMTQRQCPHRSVSPPSTDGNRLPEGALPEWTWSGPRSTEPSSSLPWVVTGDRGDGRLFDSGSFRTRQPGGRDQGQSWRMGLQHSRYDPLFGKFTELRGGAECSWWIVVRFVGDPRDAPQGLIERVEAAGTDSADLLH